MKKMLMALACAAAIPLSAHAGTVMYSDNTAGGQILLSDFECDIPNVDRKTWVYTTTDQNSNVLSGGCYTFKDGLVMSVDTDGQSHKWNLSGFTVTEYGAAKVRQNRSRN